MITIPELKAIRQLAQALGESYNPLTGSVIAVDAKVIDSNGDTLGVVRLDGSEEYIFFPVCDD